MKLLLSIISITLGCALMTTATADQSYIAPLAPQSLLLDLAKTNGGLLVVGERGHVLRSNEGQQWQQEIAPTLSTLNGVAVVNDKKWAVGHDAVIIHQPGDELPWQVQKFDPDLEKPLLDVLFFDQQEGIAIGSYGTFFRTEDGGKNWQKEVHVELLDPDDVLYLEEIRLEDESFYELELASILPHLNRITLENGVLYIAGESGLIAQSNDNGRTWQRMEVNYYGSFFDIKALQDGSLVAVGLRGNVYVLRDEQQGWQKIESGITASLNTIVPLTGGQFVAMGNSGYLLCVDGDKATSAHLSDGKAITSAIMHNDKIIAASAEGVKTLLHDQQQSVCERVNDSL